MPFILTRRENSIGTIILNRPEKRNSFSAAMLGELIAALNGFKDDGTRVLVIRAEPGAPVWSAGLDISELPTPGQDPLSYAHPIEVALRTIQHLPAPVIAMVEGGGLGAACDLCLTCDILIGAPSATFAITPAKIGVPYNSSGILHFLNVAGVRLAKEMFFTAAPIGAERALEVGILNRLVPAADLERTTYEMAGRIAENSAAGHLRHQGTAPAPRRLVPPQPGDVREDPVAPRKGLRQRRLPGGDGLVPRAAQARLQGQVGAGHRRHLAGRVRADLVDDVGLHPVGVALAVALAQEE